MSINQRVSDWFALQKKKGKTQKYFAEIWNVSSQTINQYAKSEGSVGITPISKILDYDKAISARWLLLGEGEMYEKGTIVSAKPDTIDDKVKNMESQKAINLAEIDQIQKVIEEMIKQIKIKDDQIKFLQHLIEEKI